MQQRISLNGTWQFRTDPRYEGESHNWQEHMPEQLIDVNVPHVWQNKRQIYNL